MNGDEPASILAEFLDEPATTASTADIGKAGIIPGAGRASALVRVTFRESRMQVGYLVLYVHDAEACRRFWVEQLGMVEKRRTEAGGFTIAQVGFADQPFAFELVPLEMMKNNPDGLDLATPSICFQVDDLEATHAALVERGVQASDVGEHKGMRSFAFSDPEGRWFAVTQ
jgi:lactoylglutathione lyase